MNQAASTLPEHLTDEQMQAQIDAMMAEIDRLDAVMDARAEEAKCQWERIEQLKERGRELDKKAKADWKRIEELLGPC